MERSTFRNSGNGSNPQRKIMNKAGYTVNTSRERVGRGGTAIFLTFRLDHHDQRTDGQTNRQTDKASYRVASSRLKCFRLMSLWEQINSNLISQQLNEYLKREKEYITTLKMARYIYHWQNRSFPYQSIYWHDHEYSCEQSRVNTIESLQGFHPL